MSAAYGIEGLPTTVLIDREGHVVGKFDAGKSEDREKLKEMLNQD